MTDIWMRTEDLTSMRRDLWHIRMANILNLGKSSADSDSRFKNLSRSRRKIQSERMLRRMKKDNLNDIPEKHVYKCKGEMPNYQKNVYISVIRTAHEQNLHPLQVIARLRDVFCILILVLKI